MKKFSGFHFSGQKAGEEIILVVRRHWFDIVSQLFMIFFLVLILIGSIIYIPLLFPVLGTDSFNGLFIFLENLFAMVIWILFFLIWIDYYFDVWIITNRRVVNVEQKGLFSRNVSELELENIQDITTEVHGVIPTFLNYGDVFIQTAAEKERFIFKKVSDPYRIKDVLMNLHKEMKREEAGRFGEIIRKNAKN